AAYVYADQAGTLYLEQSRDSSTWRVTATQAVTAGNSYAIQTPIIGRYVRARYVNGATAQGAFDLNTSIIF
ncbi:MAG: phage portal protein, partial [bacterium]|nr:phage portal protein [bacterium]